MKIEELITESQVTDEGVLGSIASGIGTGVGAVAKGLGTVSGAFKGAKDQYQKGQALGRAHVGGHMPKQPKDTSVRDREFARLTGQQAPGAAPAGGANPQDIAAQIKAKEAELADLKNQQKQAQKQPPQDLAPPPQSQPGIGSSSGGNNAAATATEPAQTGATAPTNTASKQANPAPEQGADNKVAQQPGATTPPPANNKMDPKAQNALKARLKAGQGAGAKTGGGFNQYVQGGGGQTLAGADANGNPVFKQNVKREDIQREGIDFYSNFLGQKL